MAQMSTVPVFACRVCGKAVAAVHVSSMNDPKAEVLKAIMKGLGDIALCDWHRAKRNWFASQGRESEFWLNPETVIYSVIDNSGLDYYRKKG